MSDLLNVAEMYRSWGLSVFPVGGMKLPTVRWKARQKAVPTPDQLAQMMAYVHRRNGAAMGLAVVHGKVSGGLACRDFDVADAYHEWAERHPDAAASLPTVRTPRGYHVWFRCPIESYHKDESGELRANRTHYSVLPPTVRTDKDGFTYQWVANEPATLSDFPLIDPVAVHLRPPHLPSEVSPPRRTKANRSEWVVDFRGAACDKLSLLPLTTSIVIREPSERHWLENTTFFDPSADPDTAVRNAILSSVPRRAGERQAHIFLLARRFKAVRATASADEWESAFNEWWRLAVRNVETKDYRVSWHDFVRAWDVCRPFVPRNDPLSMARRAALSESGSDAKMRAVCRELAKVDQSGRFMLASTLAGDLTGLSQKTAYNTLRRMVQRGEIAVVDPSCRGNMGVGHVYQLNQPGDEQ